MVSAVLMPVMQVWPVWMVMLHGLVLVGMGMAKILFFNSGVLVAVMFIRMVMRVGMPEGFVQMRMRVRFFE